MLHIPEKVNYKEENSKTVEFVPQLLETTEWCERDHEVSMFIMNYK